MLDGGSSGRLLAPPLARSGALRLPAERATLRRDALALMRQALEDNSDSEEERVETRLRAFRDKVRSGSLNTLKSTKTHLNTLKSTKIII